LYGLKQGARNWYESLKEALEQIGFKCTETDHGVFVKKWADGRLVAVGIHVDDCLTMGSSQKLLDELKRQVNGKYKMTDLEPCKWLLGIKVTCNMQAHMIANMPMSIPS